MSAAWRVLVGVAVLTLGTLALALLIVIDAIADLFRAADPEGDL